MADFMAVVFLSAQRSKDLSSEGRACIANTEDGGCWDGVQWDDK